MQTKIQVQKNLTNNLLCLVIRHQKRKIQDTRKILALFINLEKLQIIIWITTKERDNLWFEIGLD